MWKTVVLYLGNGMEYNFIEWVSYLHGWQV